MKNPLKKISKKGRKELDEARTNTINSLMSKYKAVEKKKNELDIRCQSLEITVIEQQKKIKELEELAQNRGEKIVKLRQELNEEKLISAFYSRMAERALDEKARIKRKYCTPCTEGAGEQADKEVSSNG